jgi:hypothetical protein
MRVGVTVMLAAAALFHNNLQVENLSCVVGPSAGYAPESQRPSTPTRTSKPPDLSYSLFHARSTSLFSPLLTRRR